MMVAEKLDLEEDFDQNEIQIIIQILDRQK